MSDPLASCLYVGAVRHRRHRPTSHAFSYRTYHALLDVDELPRLARELRGFGYNRPAPLSFRDTDHLGDRDLPVRDKLAAWFDGQGLTLPDGPLRVLTGLRVAGYAFDPVSWWFCHRADGSLDTIVAEVHNTFGDSLCYRLEPVPRDPAANGGGEVMRAAADKRLHVSPFLPIDGLSYRFTFAWRGDRLTAHIDVDDDRGRILDATQSGRRVALSSATLARVALTHPLLPLRTIVAIHWQALRLWRKRIPFRRRPTPPDPGYHPACGQRDAAGATAASQRPGTDQPTDEPTAHQEQR